MAKRYRYSFTKRKEGTLGKWSFGMFFLGLAFFVLAIVFTFTRSFSQSLNIRNTLAISSVLIYAYGFIIGLKSLGVKEANHRFGTFGTVLNGMMLFTWTSLIIL